MAHGAGLRLRVGHRTAHRRQLDRIGWRNRQGIGDCANQFHYYRLTRTTGSCGADTTRSTTSAAGRRRLRGPARDVPPAGRTLLPHLPPARRRAIQPPVGGRHRHQHPVLRALGPRPGRQGRVRQRIHRTGRCRGPVCRRRMPGPTGREPTPRTELEMVRKRPLPFPPEPLASIGIQATRWSLDRADHSAAGAMLCCDVGRARPRLRLLQNSASATDCSPTVLLAAPNHPRTSSASVSSAGRSWKGVDIMGDRLQDGEKLEVGHSLTSRTGHTR